jgi:drug/metabolite transporter (DMT)-like permease
MIGITIALFASMVYGLSAVLVRKNLDESSFLSAAWVVTVIGNIIVWPIALIFTNLRTVNLQSVLFFSISVILAAWIARPLYFRGMEAVGAMVNASIFVTHPVYSTILAVFLLGETLGSRYWIGMVCILAGVIFAERSLNKPMSRPRKTDRKGLVFPFLSALIISFSMIARKYGLNISKEPLLGVAIGYLLTFFLFYLRAFPINIKRGFSFSVKDIRLFWKPSACISIAWILTLYALLHEKVSIVGPIMLTEPLFIIFFTYFFLKKLEKISLKITIGTILIVIGVMLVIV